MGINDYFLTDVGISFEKPSDYRDERNNSSLELSLTLLHLTDA
jgi:hypothetical protein